METLTNNCAFDNKQELIFGKEDITPTNFNIPDLFYKKGYCVVSNIKDSETAASILQSVVNNADAKRSPLFAHFAKKTQLSKRNKIPVCEPSVQTSFSALHFDHAQPFVFETPQLMQTLVGLYCPPESVNANAKTRIVSISELFSQKKFGAQAEVEARITDYVTNHGDGWETPARANTKRLACFGRAIDAITSGHALLEQWNQRMDQWFASENDETGTKGLAQEYAFYRARGLDLAKCEEQITLRPGELLIIDNLRTIHGRIGKRERAEIWQFMFGVKETTAEDVSMFREWIAKQASE